MNSFASRHREADLLLAYLDGELPPRQSRQVKRHLEACWECRAELEALEKTVAECVRYRQEVLQAVVLPTPRAWADLSPEFQRIDESRDPSRWLARPLRWVLVAAAAATLVAATFTFRQTIFPAAPARRPEAAKVSAPLPSPASTNTRPDGLPPSAAGRAMSSPAENPAAPPAGPGDELRAVAALHELGADLGDPVEVGREGGQVIVSGTGVRPGLQRQIRDALASLPRTIVRFSDPSSPPARLAATDADGLTPPAEPPALQARLEAQLGGHAAFENFSSDLLEHDDAAMTRVYALRRLARQFAPEVEGRLAPEDRILLRNLSRDHLRALREEVQALEARALPVWRSLGASPAAPSSQPAANWEEAAENAFRSAAEFDRLLAVALGAAAPQASLQDVVQQLLSALARVQADVQQCDLLLMQ